MSALIYGNCQAVALTQILYKTLSKKYFVHRVRAVHKLTCAELDHIYDIIEQIDLLIIQPISDNYKNNPRLSTKNILQSVKSSCVIIMIPVCYFPFYYPFVTYLKSHLDEYHEHFHDINLLNLCNEYENRENIISKYIQMVNDSDLSFTEDPLLVAERSIAELEKREEQMNIYGKPVIKISQFIRNNFKRKLLFYTRNHPTKYLFEYLCKRICESIYIDSSQIIMIDPLNDKHPPLYKSLQKYVNFNISLYEPILYGASGLYNVVNQMIHIKERIDRVVSAAN